MTRTELIDTLSRKFSQLHFKDTGMSVRVILEELSNALSKGGRAEIRGFGSFVLNYKPPRKGRNPKTGVTVMVPAKYQPHFRPGKELRERVDYS